MSLFYETDCGPGVQYLELSALDVGLGVQYLCIGVRDELDLANGCTSVRSTPTTSCRVVEQDLQRATTDVKKASSKPLPPHQDDDELFAGIF